MYDDSPEALRRSFYGSGMAEYYSAVARSHKERKMPRRTIQPPVAQPTPEPVIEAAPEIPAGPIVAEPVAAEIPAEPELVAPVDWPLELGDRDRMALAPVEDDSARSRSTIG